MEETREGGLAAILARGLIRVRRRAERTGAGSLQANHETHISAEKSPADQTSVDQTAAQAHGEQR